MYYKLLFYNIRIEHQFYYLLLFLFLAGNIFVTALIKADLMLFIERISNIQYRAMCCVFLYAGMQR